MSSFQSIILFNFIIIHTNTQRIDCWDASECINQTLLTSSTISCAGAFACYHASNIISPLILECDGSYACSHIYGSSAIYDSKIYCHGSNSCTYSNMKSNTTSKSTTVFCYGYSSCSHSYIFNAKNVDARGAYSLYNASIETTDNVLDLDLRGFYAGFGAHIICHSNATCNIRCYFNGCFMTYLDCHQGSNCTIYTYTNHTVHPITNISLLDLTPNLQHLFDEETMNNNKQCNNNTKSTSFDLYQEQMGGTINVPNDDYICCRGYESCYDNDIIHRGNTLNTKVICSSMWSCSNTNITSDSMVSCEGASSCYGWGEITHITAPKHIQCLGQRSCYDTYIYNALKITCGGEYSCENANMYTSDLGQTHNVYLIGYFTASNSNIHCKTNDECFILCGSFQSCEYTNLICDGICTVECGEESSCPIISGSSASVTIIPSKSTSFPTSAPTFHPTTHPTIAPTTNPTTDPTTDPTRDPTTDPISDLTTDPTTDSTTDPTTDPTTNPSVDPTVNPTQQQPLDVTVINITLYINGSISNDEVINTVITYLIAKGINNPLDTDIIQSGGTLIVAFQISQQLEGDEINIQEIGDILAKEYDGKVKVKDIKVNTHTIDDIESESNQNAYQYVWIILIVFSVFCVLLLIGGGFVIWYKKQKQICSKDVEYIETIEAVPNVPMIILRKQKDDDDNSTKTEQCNTLSEEMKTAKKPKARIDTDIGKLNEDESCSEGEHTSSNESLYNEVITVEGPPINNAIADNAVNDNIVDNTVTVSTAGDYDNITSGSTKGHKREISVDAV